MFCLVTLTPIFTKAVVMIVGSGIINLISTILAKNIAIDDTKWIYFE